MENKQSMIEEWAKKVEHSKKKELSKEAAKHFMTICLNAKKIVDCRFRKQAFRSRFSVLAPS